MVKSGVPENSSELEKFGLPPEQIEALTCDDADEFEVMPGNWEAVHLFLALQTQWRCNEMNGAYCGLDYVAVESVLRLHRSRDRKATFSAIQAMEYAALDVLNRDK